MYMVVAHRDIHFLAGLYNIAYQSLLYRQKARTWYTVCYLARLLSRPSYILT